MEHFSFNIHKTPGFFNRVELTCDDDIKISNIKAYPWLFGKILSLLPFKHPKVLEVHDGSKTCYLKYKNFQKKEGSENFKIINKNGSFTLERFPKYGLTEQDYEAMKAYDVSNLKIPTLIRRKGARLPRSLVHIPEGPQKGTYVLLKTHGDVEEVGRGSFNKVTLAIDLETRKVKVFRNAKKDHVYSSELDVNEKLASQPDKFSVGTPIFYQGPWRDRHRNIQNPPREKNVEKVGIIMDLIEGGELNDQKNKLSFKEKVRIAAECADIIADLHDQNLIHSDLKLKNIFMTKDGHPRIGDFGFTCPKDTPIVNEKGHPIVRGTPGKTPPEMITAYIDRVVYKSDFSGDIWSFGCMLADLLNDSNWKNEKKTGQDFEGRTLSLDTLNKIKDKCFPNRKVAGSYDEVIDRCLLLNPKKRPSAREVANMLREIHKKLP